jgi:hypothetical protein
VLKKGLQALNGDNTGIHHFIAPRRYYVFYKLKEQDRGRYFSNSMCPLHVSVSHFGNSRNISIFFIIIISVMVICDQ